MRSWTYSRIPTQLPAVVGAELIFFFLGIAIALCGKSMMATGSSVGIALIVMGAATAVAGPIAVLGLALSKRSAF